MTVWRNDINRRYIFMFSMSNLARKGLTTTAHLFSSMSLPSWSWARRVTMVTLITNTDIFTGIILGMGLTNGRRLYIATPPLIGRAHTQNDPCFVVSHTSFTASLTIPVHACTPCINDESEQERRSCLLLPYWYRADSRFAPSQWETALLCNDVSHWLGTSLESALLIYMDAIEQNCHNSIVNPLEWVSDLV